MTLNRVGADCVVDVREQILISELICIHFAARGRGWFEGKSLEGPAVKVKTKTKTDTVLVVAYVRSGEDQRLADVNPPMRKCLTSPQVRNTNTRDEIVSLTL